MTKNNLKDPGDHNQADAGEVVQEIHDALTRIQQNTKDRKPPEKPAPPSADQVLLTVRKRLCTLIDPRFKEKFPEGECIATPPGKLYELYHHLAEYFAGDPLFSTRGEGFSLDKGIMLRGACGVGKTLALQVFSNSGEWDDHMTLPRAPFKGKIISCEKLKMKFSQAGWEALDYLIECDPRKPISTFSYVFDDLGAEAGTTSYYGTKVNIMESILMERYNLMMKYGVKTHITTNLVTGDDISQLYGERIRSRCRQMFNIFDVEGQDLRK